MKRQALREGKCSEEGKWPSGSCTNAAVRPLKSRDGGFKTKCFRVGENLFGGFKEGEEVSKKASGLVEAKL